MVADPDWSSEELVSKIISGDQDAETALFKLYYRGLIFILEQRSCSKQLAEDLAQETLLSVLAKIRDGKINQPEYLPRFVQQTARYVHIGWTRRLSNQTELRETVDDLADDRTDPVNDLILQQKRDAVRQLITELKIPRDREVLYRYYIDDEDKPAICHAMMLEPGHFDTVINRAKSRFKELASRYIQ